MRANPVRALAHDLEKASARAEQAIQAQIQTQAQGIEADARSLTDSTAVLTTFGDGASVTGDLSQTDVGQQASDLASATASIGAQKLLGP